VVEIINRMFPVLQHGTLQHSCTKSSISLSVGASQTPFALEGAVAAPDSKRNNPSTPMNALQTHFPSLIIYTLFIPLNCLDS
jgi:hypothetical protein